MLNAKKVTVNISKVITDARTIAQAVVVALLLLCIDAADNGENKKIYIKRGPQMKTASLLATTTATFCYPDLPNYYTYMILAMVMVLQSFFCQTRTIQKNIAPQQQYIRSGDALLMANLLYNIPGSF